MPEKAGLPVRYRKVDSDGEAGRGSDLAVEMTQTQHRAVKKVEDLFNQGWTEAEIENALMADPQLPTGYEVKNKTNRVTTAFIPLSSGDSNVPIFENIARYTRRLDDIMFYKHKHGGVGFKVTCDASGKNAIVSKVKDPHLLEKGLCVGAVVTHIEDLEVIDMDHFDILEKYRGCHGHFSMIFKVPGLKPHTVSRDPVRKSGHKLTSCLLVLSCLISIAALTYNELHVADIRDFPNPGQKTELIFRWNQIDIKVGDSGAIFEEHYSHLKDDDVYGSEWDQVLKPGSLFFGCTIASIVLYIFLLLLSIILATRRPKALIQESGETIRSVFIILNMIVCLTTIATWAAWISEFNFPETIKIGDVWHDNLSAESKSENISTSIILEIVTSFCMIVSIFTAVVQK